MKLRLFFSPKVCAGLASLLLTWTAVLGFPEEPGYPESSGHGTRTPEGAGSALPCPSWCPAVQMGVELALPHAQRDADALAGQGHPLPHLPSGRCA